MKYTLTVIDEGVPFHMEHFDTREAAESAAARWTDMGCEAVIR